MKAGAVPCARCAPTCTSGTTDLNSSTCSLTASALAAIGARLRVVNTCAMHRLTVSTHAANVVHQAHCLPVTLCPADQVTSQGRHGQPYGVHCRPVSGSGQKPTLFILYSTLYDACTSFSTASASTWSRGSDTHTFWLACTCQHSRAQHPCLLQVSEHHAHDELSTNQCMRQQSCICLSASCLCSACANRAASTCRCEHSAQE